MQAELRERAIALGVLRPGETPHECRCDHALIGSGAVFFQSRGILFCNNCRGFQLIRKPVEP